MTRAPAAGFEPHWLELREPVDHRSRAVALLAPLDDWLLQRQRARPDLSAVDLGAGTGSNWRYLSARLRMPLQWRLLDQDAILLGRLRPGPAHVAVEVADLAQPLTPLVAGADLVTASALIDLAGSRWIDGLAQACSAARAAVLVTLTVDGRVAFDPPDALDGQVLDWLTHDEQRDKGLGAALGPAAPAALAAALRAQGHAVATAASDWCLAPADAPLALALLDGWRAAARRSCPARDAEVAAWFGRRADAIAAGRLRVRVGHQDILGLPPA